MAAIATIKNPLSLKETLIFYCTEDLHVGLNVQGERPNDRPHPAPGRGGDPGSSVASAAEDEVEAAADAPSTKGVLINPSSFGTIRYKDLVSFLPIEPRILHSFLGFPKLICGFARCLFAESGATTRFVSSARGSPPCRDPRYRSLRFSLPAGTELITPGSTASRERFLF